MGGARRRAGQEWALIEERDQLAGQNDRLRHLLRQLQRMRFGRRSEKLDPDQFNLAPEDLEQAVAASEAEQEKTDPALRQTRSEKRRAGRGALPEHLPRVEIRSITCTANSASSRP